MRTLVKKTEKGGFFKLEAILGASFMGLAMLALPIGIISYDPSLMTNPFVFGVVFAGMLFFGLVGYFGFIHKYLLYRRTPAVQAECDGEFLYIHTKREAKIPLSALTEASVRVHMPFLLQKDFWREIISHLLSEEYGDIYVDISGFGTFKMRYVSYVNDTADELLGFFNYVLNDPLPIVEV